MEREIEFIEAAAMYLAVVDDLLTDYPELYPLYVNEDLAYSAIGSALQTWNAEPLIPDGQGSH